MPVGSSRRALSWIALLAAAPAAHAIERRCATPEPFAFPSLPAAGRLERLLGGPGPEDCSLAATDPRDEYAPTSVWTIPVVVHVIRNSACTEGNLTDADVESQIAALDEDFGALPGTPGEDGVDSGIRFALATVDPDGAPTTGIVRYCNDLWYGDDAPYWETIAWDPHHYLNLYSNTADNARGYVPFLPAAPDAEVGDPLDRVVVNVLAFGRQVPPPIPHHAGGRTATHEIGHYLGLFHTYYEGCGDGAEPGCHTSGDRICDTPPDAAAQDVCPVGATSCGGAPSPIWNYMQLTDDPCMTGFTAEQARRVRCTIRHYRPGLLRIFADGFESGDTGRWSSAVP